MLVATLEGNGRVTKMCPQSGFIFALEQSISDLVSMTLDAALRCGIDGTREAQLVR